MLLDAFMQLVDAFIHALPGNQTYYTGFAIAPCFTV